jgi:3-hydroxypropanoate dehydrogenase
MDATLAKEKEMLSEAALARLFTKARTHSSFDPTPLPITMLQRLYHLASLGPTSMNCQPARFVFIASKAGRERLLPHVLQGNQAKVQSAPVTVIVARDKYFYEWMPKLWHLPQARENFERQAELAYSTAVRNATLTGAYLLLAARALGLSCGPMSGFDADGVNSSFFSDGRWEVDFLVNLGYAVGSPKFDRGPRLDFDQACVMA